MHREVADVADSSAVGERGEEERVSREDSVANDMSPDPLEENNVNSSATPGSREAALVSSSATTTSATSVVSDSSLSPPPPSTVSNLSIPDGASSDTVYHSPEENSAPLNAPPESAENAEEEWDESDWTLESSGGEETGSMASSDEVEATLFPAAATVGPDESYIGCKHYKRKCKIVTPCCGRIYACRHCHNETEKHEVDRFAVEEVVCCRCDSRQPFSAKCVSSECGSFAVYCCLICKFFDDDGEKKECFHCDECGICRVGGRANYFHCATCGSCYPVHLRNNHVCVERAMRNDCPVCMEDMFSSTRRVSVLRCGHTIHEHCLKEWGAHTRAFVLRCPLCLKSTADPGAMRWDQLAAIIREHPLPEADRRRVRILCNDCHEKTVADFHYYGVQCSACKSFNTAILASAEVESVTDENTQISRQQEDSGQPQSPNNLSDQS